MAGAYEENGRVYSFQLTFAYEQVYETDRAMIGAAMYAYDGRLLEGDIDVVINALGMLRPETYDGGGTSVAHFGRTYFFWRVDDVCELWGEWQD